MQASMQHLNVSRQDRERTPLMLRLDPAVHASLTRWAVDEGRSLNAQIEVLLRHALDDAELMPEHARPLPPRGRPSTRQHLAGSTATGYPSGTHLTPDPRGDDDRHAR